MPDAPTDLPAGAADISRGAAHAHRSSLSAQSKMRSSSFRRSSQGFSSADGDSVQDVFRKHSTRIDELEKDKKRLEKQVQDANGQWRKTEDQLQELREANVDSAELKQKLKKAEEKITEMEAMVGFDLFFL